MVQRASVHHALRAELGSSNRVVLVLQTGKIQDTKETETLAHHFRKITEVRKCVAGLDSWREALKAVRWNPMLKRGLQDGGDTKTIGCPLRKAADRDPAKGETGCAGGSGIGGVELCEPTETTPPRAQTPDKELQVARSHPSV